MRYNQFIRGRNGKFIDTYSALTEWIVPLLESFRDDERALVTMCEYAARWCEKHAHVWFKWASDAAIDMDHEPASREQIAGNCASAASTWFKRAAILRECAEKLKAVR